MDSSESDVVPITTNHIKSCEKVEKNVISLELVIIK